MYNAKPQHLSILALFDWAIVPPSTHLFLFPLIITHSKPTYLRMSVCEVDVVFEKECAYMQDHNHSLSSLIARMLSLMTASIPPSNCICAATISIDQVIEEVLLHSP